MLHIKETIVVEGKFDREQLKKITDAAIICTGGFSLYTNKDIIKSIRSMAKKTGVIILTDSDSAGFRIRNYIKQCVGDNGTVKHAYIPTVEGKEHRKRIGGKEGLLGVEGIDEELLKNILKNVTEEYIPKEQSKKITKAMLYADGLSGGNESAEKRKKLAKLLGLPVRMTANAMLNILNSAVGYEDYKAALAKIDE